MSLRVFLIVLTFMLSSCASYPKVVSSWSSALPPVDIFLSEYESDIENQAEQSVKVYLTWIKRFYEGWVVYDNGWLNMSVELTSRVEDPSERQKVQEKIHELGLMIAPEWAKEKSNRYIKTKAVAAWGDSLLEALSRGDVMSLMESVVLDIERMKQGQLSSDDIRIERYFPDVEIDDDDSFFF